MIMILSAFAFEYLRAFIKKKTFFFNREPSFRVTKYLYLQIYTLNKILVAEHFSKVFARFHFEQMIRERYLGGESRLPRIL